MKLKDILNFKEKDFFDCNRVLKRSMKGKGAVAWVSICLILCAVILVIGGIFFLRPLQEAEEEIKITGSLNIIESVESTKGALHAFPLDAAIKIQTSEDVSAAEMKARLRVVPAVEYAIKKVGDCSYQLTLPALSEGALYRLEAVYQDRVIDSWALQAQKPLSITAVSPENQAGDLSAPIEITFSHADVSGVEDAFSIEPKVEGKMEHHGKVWRFTPSAPLEAGTLYLVTIKDTVKGPDGISLGKDHSFGFLTDYGNSYAYTITEGSAIDSFLVNEAPVATIAWNNIDATNAKVKIFAFKDAEDFKTAYQSNVCCGVISPEIKDAEADSQYQFEAKPFIAENYGSIKKAAFIQYPQALPKGYYFSEIEIGGKVLYQLLQITELSVYHLTAGGDYVVWVNDAISSLPIKGGKVTIDGFSPSKTSASGVCLLKNGEEADGERWLTIERDGDIFFDVLKESEQADGAARFLSYMETSAPYGIAGEKIGIYGAILPKKAEEKLPSSILLKGEFFEEELPLDKNGVFYKEITLPEPLLSDLEFSAWVDEDCVATCVLKCMEKIPRYYISVSTDKKCYSAGEVIAFTGEVKNADGTPAIGVMVEDGAGFEGKTDQSGKVSGSFLAKAEEQDGENLSVQSLSLRVSGQEEESSFEPCYYLLMRSPYLMEAEIQEDELIIGLFALSSEGAEALDQEFLYFDQYDLDALKGEAVDREIYGELHELSYVKSLDGSTYDPYSQKVVDKITFAAQDSMIRSFEAESKNGVCRLKFSELSASDKSYYVDLYLKENHQFLRRVYLSEYQRASAYNRNNIYNLVASSNSFDIGEQVDFQVRAGSDNSILNSGSVLYTVVSDGVADVYFSNATQFSMDYLREYAPDVLVYGAYFDGKHCYSLGCEYLRYAEENSALSVEMSADKSEYQAGDLANLSFKVKDAEGEPMDATLVVYLMDKQVFRRGNLQNPLKQIYGTRCLQSQASVGSSYGDFNLGDEVIYKAIESSELPWAPMQNSSNLVFESFSVSGGEGTLEIKVPQEYADWKVVVSAVSQGGQASLAAFDLSPSKKLYTDALLFDEIALNEEGAFLLKAECKEAVLSDLCDYSIVISDADGMEVYKSQAQGILGAYEKVTFDALPAGNYTAYIETRISHLKDRRIMHFSVSASEDRKSGFEELSGAVSHAIELAGDQPSVVAILDQESALWAESLAFLGEGEGDELDRLLANALYDGFAKEGYEAKDRVSLAQFSDYIDQGMKWTAQDAQDLKLSAVFSAICPQGVDKDQLIAYFNQYLSNSYASKQDILLSYWGLAALGEPIYEELLWYYKEAGEISSEEAVSLALSFAYIGDYQTAKAIYQQYISSGIVGDREKHFSENNQVNGNSTELLAMLAAKINHSDAEGLLRYCLANEAELSYSRFAAIAYLFDYIGQNNEEREFKVTIDGRAEEYSQFKGFPLVFVVENAKELRISSLDAGYMVAYSGF